MIVRIGNAPRAAGTTVEEFQTHWSSGHADVARQLPGLRSYLQNHAVLQDGLPLLPYPGFDACSEIEFDSLQAMDDAFASEHFQEAVTADEQGFIDQSRFTNILAERRVVKAGAEPTDGVRLLSFWRVCPGATPEQAAQLLADAPVPDTVILHEQLVEIPGAHDGRKPSINQVVDILVFPTTDDALAHLQSIDSNMTIWSLGSIAQATGRLIGHVIPVVDREGRI
ncbi:MAG: EthD domain-containing protein [Solirubrobacteraceae bacterium]|nr:EthD domain-containing protein [Patulibacter sp.]